MGKTKLSPIQYRVLKEVLALRELTRKNGMSTTRTQNERLQSLNSEDLAIVAAALTSDPDIDRYEIDGNK